MLFTPPTTKIQPTICFTPNYDHRHSIHTFTNPQTSPPIPYKLTHKLSKLVTFPALTARSAHITPLARRRSASRAYARENTLPSSAKWGPFRCSFSERTRRCSQSDRTYRPYYPPILQPHKPDYLPAIFTGILTINTTN